MPIKIDSQHFYSTTETCQKTGISRATLYRWLRKGLLSKQRKDRRGWRLFTEEDLQKILSESKRIEIIEEV